MILKSSTFSPSYVHATIKLGLKVGAKFYIAKHT